MRRGRRNSIGEDLIKGAIAGAVATWVMGKVTGAMYAPGGPLGPAAGGRRPRRARQPTAWPPRGRPAPSGATLGDRPERAARRRAPLGARHRRRRGLRGARRRFGLGRVAGVGFGTLFWAAVDEGLVPALGLTPGPRAFPWQTHARGLAGHLTFGTVTDGPSGCSTRWPDQRLALGPRPAIVAARAGSLRALPSSASRMIRPCSAACAAG